MAPLAKLNLLLLLFLLVLLLVAVSNLVLYTTGVI